MSPTCNPCSCQVMVCFLISLQRQPLFANALEFLLDIKLLLSALRF